MKSWLSGFVVILGLWLGGLAHAEPSVEGTWMTIDDVTGKPKGIVKVWQNNGVLYGKVIKLIAQPGVPLVEYCHACKGAQKDKPVVGMTIMWGLKPDGEGGWSGGTILDPKLGKTYRCLVSSSADGKTLKVRGYIGFSLLGRTQTWQRESQTR